MSIVILIYGKIFYQEFVKNSWPTFIHYTYQWHFRFCRWDISKKICRWHCTLFCSKNHILNQSILTRNFVYLQKWFHDHYMVLNPGKYYYMTFGLNTSKNEFVLEDGTIIPSAKKHVVLEILINFRLNLLFSFETIMQKDWKQTKCFDNNCSIS